MSYHRPTSLAPFLLTAGSALRVAYGAASLLYPERMAAAQLAPEIDDQAEPRLLLRAFGGHQLLVGTFTLASMRKRRLARVGAGLSLAVDAFDVTSALLEWRARGRADRTVGGGIALSGGGVLVFGSALRMLRR